MPENDEKGDLRRSNKSRQTLEKLIKDRTAELARSNEALTSEVARRQRVEDELSMLLTAAKAALAAKDLPAALSGTLEQLCQSMHWDRGEVWIPNEDRTAIVLSSSYQRGDEDLAQFNLASEALSFEPGQGLPGRVWLSGQLELYEDVSSLSESEFPRASAASAAGLKIALCVPILGDDQILAVLTLFARAPRQVDPRAVEMVSAAAVFLGQILHQKQIQDALNESESLFRAIVDNSTRVIYVKDKEGRYITVNRQYEKQHHVTREEIRGRTDYEIYSNEFADRFRANDIRVAESGLAMEFEELAPLDDGPHTFISNKYPIFDSSGDLYAVCGISTDITGQKQLEESLRSARDSLRVEVDQRTSSLIESHRALLDLSREQQRILEALEEVREFSESLLNTAQVIVLLLDPAGNIRYFNPCFEQVTGYSLAEVKGKDWFTTFLPERDRRRIRALFDAALKDFPVYGNVNPILTKNGQEREIEWSAKTLQDANGQLLGLLCSGVDITELRKAETWFKALVGSVQDAMVSINRQGRIVMFNPAAEHMFGYSRVEIAGNPVSVLMPEPYASEHSGYLSRYEATGEPHAIGRIRVVSGKRKNGEVFPIELSVTEISTGTETHYAAFIRDITDKVRLQEQAMEKERLATIGTTAAKIGHELANPLNGMYLATQLLEHQLEKSAADGGNREAILTLRKIKGEISRLNALLEDFRSLARRETYRFRPTEISALIEEIADTERVRCAAAGIELNVVGITGLPKILADRDKIKQALLNLCKNSLESMPSGGKLTIKASASDHEVTVDVIDTGSGIAEERDIFEPFFTTKKQGTGLGLTIVRQLIAAHEGTVTYHSQPGVGTTFRLVLPRK